MTQVTGIGDPDAPLNVYIANRPPLPEFQALDTVRPLFPGELADVVLRTGNHWRKIFNLYAKLAFALQADRQGSSCWQDYRDHHLLQSGSGQALLFSPPEKPLHDGVHIITGRSYAASLEPGELTWLDRGFATSENLIVCPYFDYRQLSNAKLEQLIKLAVGCAVRTEDTGSPRRLSGGSR